MNISHLEQVPPFFNEDECGLIQQSINNSLLSDTTTSLLVGSSSTSLDGNNKADIVYPPSVEEFQQMDKEEKNRIFAQAITRITELENKNTQLHMQKQTYAIKLATMELLMQNNVVLEKKKQELSERFWQLAMTKIQKQV